MATSGADIGAAWLEDNWLLHFTRFGPDLTVLSDTGCLGSMTERVALASAPTGWLVAEEAGGAAGIIHIFALDATGTLRGTRDIPLPMPGYGDLKLIQQSQGGPLLLWETGLGKAVTVNAQILAGDASDVGARVTLSDVGGSSIAGVFTGSGFELAWSHQPDGLPIDAIQLAHVALDGTLRMDSSIAGMVPAWPLRLVWTGSEARLIYAGWLTVTPNPTIAMFLLRLTASGATVGSPVQISPGGEILDPASLLAVGDDALGLRNWIDLSGAHLNLRRVSSSGATVWAPFSFAQAPGYDAMQMVQLGADAIVGWYEGDVIAARLGLTKIALAP
jgi:hypothetical protein